MSPIIPQFWIHSINNRIYIKKSVTRVLVYNVLLLSYFIFLNVILPPARLTMKVLNGDGRSGIESENSN